MQKIFLLGKINLSNINESHLKALRLENTMNKLKRLSYPTNNKFSCSSSKVGSPVEKHVTENCLDISNIHKYSFNNIDSNKSSNTSAEVPYHKHIRYEVESEKQSLMLNKKIPPNTPPLLNLSKHISKSCTQIYPNAQDRAIIVDMHPKGQANVDDFHSLDRKLPKKLREEEQKHFKSTIPPIALPRCLGLSRKWRGPVKYPVTPVKKAIDCGENGNKYLECDEAQVFI